MKVFLQARRKVLALLASVVVLLVIAGWAFHHGSAPDIPTAEVRRGEFVDTIEVHGEVQALHSIQLIAPSIPGDLQIVKLVPTGTMVKKGDIVAQFDTSNLQRTLEQRQSELKSAEADIERVRADSRLLKEQQATDLLQAGYDVDRAKLDTTKQEILSDIDGAENKLKLADAQQHLKELQQKDTSTQASAAADIESKKQRRTKAVFDVNLAQRQISFLTLRAPADGMVTLMPNYRMRNGMMGGSTPDFREGDRAWSGAVVAEIPDLSNIRVRARVDESDRGRMKVGQTASVRIDAIAGKEFPATVAEISPLAKPDYTSWPVTKNFDIAVQIQDKDARIKPGMSAGGRIAIEKIANGILVPAGAVFDKNGRSVAYVLKGSQFEERTVQVARRSKSDLLISSGVQPGEKVALKDPTVEQQPQ